MKKDEGWYADAPMPRALGIADGWGVRACAAALTVGLIFWLLFDQVFIEIFKRICEITEQKMFLLYRSEK